MEAALQRVETCVFFDSPHRIVATLQILAELEPDRPTVVARELTKKFEEFRRGTAAQLAAAFDGRTVKGEIVLMVAGAKLAPWMKRRD